MAFRRMHGLALGIAVALLAGCGGGSGRDTTGTAPPPNAPSEGCTGSCAGAESRLTVADVQTVIAQAVAEAQANNLPATIAVVDRVGNVLGVYRMTNAQPTVAIHSERDVAGGLEDLIVPSELAAIAKAMTGAYLSSEGNAFTTRTASQIVQQAFNPGESNAPSGPLFGVQFSQLPCSDFMTRFQTGQAAGPGPRRSPLGLSADPGGFPLYKNGVPVGGIGVAADPDYTLDARIFDRDRDVDEMIALAGTFNFGAPVNRRADAITADGKTFRYSDVEFADLARTPGNAPALTATMGAFIKVPAYADAIPREGTAFGTALSGIRAAGSELSDLDAFIVVDAANQNRYPARAGTDGSGALSANEAQTVLREALKVANRARAQIRQPFGTQARVSVSVVDTNGAVLALARTRDAPVFGLDVSLQKARSAMFFSNANAAAGLNSLPNPSYFGDTVNLGATPPEVRLRTVGTGTLSTTVARTREFLGSATALADGAIAFSDRAIGNLARPYYPDGITGQAAGPFSNEFNSWSPFDVGLQLDLAYSQIALHVAHYLNQAGLALYLDGQLLAPPPSTQNPVPLPDIGFNCTGLPSLANGIQIFPGAVPIYRGDRLVGAIGVSGDGVDQDDMVSFLGLHNASVALNGAIGHAPTTRRADLQVPRGARLRYVQCPQAPFIDSTEQNVCEGK
ncbi:MAG: heme-binding protein [Rhodanobacteraceae bacterium]|nr:heme-binding protein [Rhodanobacteraceae bacterium]